MTFRGGLITIGGVVLFGAVAWVVPMTKPGPATIGVQLTEPDVVTWEGVVVGVLRSGESLAVVRTDGFGAFMAELASAISAFPDGAIRISGKRGEDTCAYRDTVFAGECVPQLLDARIDQIE